MASPSKRARTGVFERELEPSEIDCVEKNVTVHGVVTELSPVKASKRNPSTKYLIQHSMKHSAHTNILNRHCVYSGV